MPCDSWPYGLLANVIFGYFPRTGANTPVTMSPNCMALHNTASSGSRSDCIPGPAEVASP